MENKLKPCPFCGGTKFRTAKDGNVTFCFRCCTTGRWEKLKPKRRNFGTQERR